MLLKDLSINNKGYYGIGASSCAFNSGFPSYLRITDISDDGRVNFPLETCIDIDQYPDWRNYLLNLNDIVFARTGNSTGRNYFCSSINRDTVFAGFLIKFSLNDKLVNPKYVGYYCQSNAYWNQIRSLFTGSTRANVNAEQYGLLQIPVIEMAKQQHIVNTIGSADDLIENLQAQINNLIKIGLLKIDELNEKEELLNFSNIATLNKGFEVGSANYFEGYENKSIHYIRVGDLNSLSNTFVKETNELKVANENDILIAFDGAPGRNAVGVSGAYSSGIYKVNTNQKNKGLCFFELNSKMNQKIISDHSQGTTILHASKSIEHLKTVGVEHAEKFDPIFNQIVLLKKKINLLKNQKNLLLEKYFTN